MSTPSKDKGDRAERDVVKHLAAHGFPHARRTKAGGEKDLGDLSGVVDRDGDLWCVQVADRRWRGHGEVLAKAAEAERQAILLAAPFWCLVAKRPGCSDVGDWFVWLPANLLADCVGSAGYNGWTGIPRPVPDLACVTVRTWLALVAPEAAEAAA